MTVSLMVTCPECAHAFNLATEVSINELLTCKHCKARLFVANIFGSGSVLLKPAVGKAEAKCPECDSTVILNADVQKGEIVVCGDCGVDLEVRETTPEITLALAPQEQEDWGE